MGPCRWPLLWGFHAVLAQVAVLTAGQRPQERPPRPAGWSPAPSSSWAPTLEPGAPGDGEGSAAALAFLRTGDAQRLARANCSGAVAAAAPGPGPPPALRAALRAAPEALAHAANFLNMLFQTNDIREASVAEDVEWYQALVRSLAEGHPWVRRAVLALDAHPLAPKPRLMLQATKGDGQILLQDVSNAAPSLGNLSWDNEWFNALKSQRVPALRKRVLSNDLRSLETPKWQRGDSYVGDPGHVRWSPPFLECREGRFLPAWAVTLSSAFYGLKPDLSPEFKGVVRVDVELRDVAIDQCSSGPGWFSDTHRCDLNSTQESRGFVLGRYLCRCKPGFYGASGVASGAWAGVAGTDGGSRLGCRPCRPGCATCEDDTPCLIQEDPVLRAAVLSCQACCMLAIFLSMLVSYHFRRSKRIRTSGIILLETILFGSLLLYFPVFILYFKPSIFRCIVLRWVRMLGFAIVYGTITLKLYRVLKVFLSRTAQRAPYVSSGRVLKMLAPILLLVLWFLAAWTIGMLENAHKNIPLVIRAQTARGLHFSICGHDCWDYMMVIAEMLFLLWGSFLCYATRAVPSAFHEPRYMGIALHNELVISAAFHVVRFLIVPSLHPDWTLLLFFAHTHGTVTMTLALLFIPKFLHTGSPLREEITAEVYEDELDMRRSGSCMNSSIASAWSEHSLDPDDIREELKKLYRQLEVHKTWRMAANNPHLPKKRSSRRSLARSILRRSGAEPAESASRRSSAGDRPGTLSRRSSSAKRLVDAGGTSLRMRDESSRRRSSALRKSRSSEGPPRDPRRGSPTPSPPEEPPPVVTDLEQSDSDSLDAAPLLCKSASAQNLAGPWQRPPGRAPPLQKSHSVVAGPREAALLAARTAARDEWHGSRQLSAPAPGVSEGTATLRGPAERGSRGDAAPLGDAKGHKHVTYAPVKSVSVDSAHPPRRVRVTVKKTPPPPPVRYQSLQRSGTLGDGSEPPPEPPAPAGEEEGTAGEEPERALPPVGKGRLLTPTATPAQICPWELVQDEILSRKQKAAEAAGSGTPGDTAATTPGPKPAPQKSFRSLGLAIKALNRSRGKSILKGNREREGSLWKRGSSRRDKSGLAEASAGSLGLVSPDPAAKSPEGSGQSLEPPALEHNNNAATPGEATAWGDSGTGGQWDSLAPGTGDGDKAAEEPSAARRGLEPPGAGHQGAECPPEVTQAQPQEGDEAPALDLGEDVPAVAAEEGTLERLEGTSGSFQPREHPEEEQPPAKPSPSSPRPSPGSVRRAAGPKPRAELCPPGSLGIPAGRGALLLRQEAIAPREDGGIPESPDKELEKGSSQPEPEGGPGRSWSGAGSAAGGQGELRPGGTRGDSSSKPGIYPGKGGSEGDSQRSPGMEKPPEPPKEAPEQAEGRRAEVCPGESREQGRSVRAEICPWNTEQEQEGGGSPKSGEGVEQPGVGLAGKPPALPKPSGTMESRKANICPWEVGDEPRPKPEICPWEEAAAPSGKEKSSLDTRGTSKGEEKVGSKALEKGKQPPAKAPTGSSALPKAASGKSQSSESLKAEICPWESQDLQSSDKSEICPWEVAAPPSGKEKPNQDKEGPSRVSKSPSTTQGPLKEVRDGTSGMKDRESICPWESPDTEQPPAKAPTGISALPKAASGKSQSSESLKAEICPWEVAAPPSGKEKPNQDKEGPSRVSKSPSTTQGPLKEVRDGTSGMKDRESICPWESQDIQSSDKSEICPWEVAEPQLEKGAAPGKERLPGKGATKAVEKGSRERESICPWESLDTEQPPAKAPTGSSALPKAASGKSQSSESLKAEICPWEVAEPPSQQPKAEQVPGGGSKGDKRITRQAALASPERPRDSRERESICPWESLDMEQPPAKAPTGSSALPKAASGKSQSAESLKAEICPWEVAEPPSGKEKPNQDKEGPSRVSKSPSTTQGPLKEVRDGTSGMKDRESICPWESSDTEQPPAKAPTGSSALPKAASGKSQSSESLKAEICPWESQDLQSGDKSKICPWEVAEPQLEKGAAPGKERLPGKGATKAVEKGSRERESICPWESPDMEQPPAKAPTGSSALPKSSSGKSQSSESLKAEICPWESQDLPSSDKSKICPWESQDLQSSDKSEICPWEVAEPPSQQPKAEQVPGGGSKGDKRITRQAALASPERPQDSRERESICPWESLDMEQPPAKALPGSSALPKAASGKSQSSESLKAEICPWESQDLQSNDKSEICPWEVAEPQLEKGAAPGKVRLPGKGATKAVDKGSRERESICPWESPDMEQPPAKAPTGSSALPKAASGKSQSSESLKAEICPWESQDLQSSDKAEICPWEVAAPQMEKGAAPGKERLPGKGATKAVEKGSRERESICPWESPDTEQPPAKAPTGSSALPKAASGKSQSSESLKAEICPWESQDLQSGDKSEICPWESQDLPSSDKSEICPWEVAAPPSGKEKPNQDKEGPSRVSKSPSTTQGPLKEVRDGTSGMKDRESICPWESSDREQPPAKAPTGSSALPKAASGKSQSSESLKAEICPWEVAEPPSQQPKAEQVPGGGSKGDKRITRQAALASPERPRDSRERESICPWESLDMEQPPAKAPTGSSALPKAASGKSQSAESLKAEICPWEVAEPPSGKEKPNQDKEGPSRVSKSPSTTQGPLKEVRDGTSGMKDRESICPWESSDTEQPPAKAPTGSSALPKAASGKSQSSESLKAEICPWESQDLQSGDKSKICPWEVAEPQLEKGAAPGKERLPGKGATKAVEKGSRERESICPWESPDMEQPPAKAPTGSSALPKSSSGKSQSSESLKAEICPWESQDLPSSDKSKICPWESQDLQSSDKSEICPWEVAEPPSQQPKAEQVPGGGSKGDKRITRQAALASPERPQDSRERESICPWESLDMEQPPAKALPGSSALPKAASGKSQSSESLKAEICPWESQDLQSNDKSEICPWEVAEPQLEKGAAPGKVRLPGKGATKAVDKGSRERESICPWESPDMEQPPAKAPTGSSALPKAASGKSQSSESLKAEICPWESQDLQSSDKAEICPWEVAAPQMEKGAAPGKERLPGKGATKAVEKGSRERESICPWESPDTEQPPAKAPTGSSALPKAASGKSQSSESLKAEICPWESQDLQSGDKSEICPWESQDLPSSDKSEICPWEVAAPPSGKEKPNQDKEGPSRVSKSPSTTQGPLKEVRDGTSGMKDRESICPWESSDREQPPAKAPTGSSALPKAASGKSQSSESLKAEICPWEVAEPPSQQPKAEQVPGGGSKGDKRITRQAALASPERPRDSRERESICPWESLDTEQPPAKAPTGSSALPKAASGKSQSAESLKAEICPWEVAAPPSGKEKPNQDKEDPSRVSKSPSTTQGPLKEVRDGTSGMKDRESICPWESLDMGELSLKAAVGKEPSKKSESTESRKSEICPWEAAEPLGSEEGSSQPGVQPQGAHRASSTGMGKPGASAAAPTVLEKSRGRSHGEAEHKPLCRLLPSTRHPGVGSSSSPGTSLAEVGPWEAGEAPSASAKPSWDTRKSSEVCPWEEESTDPT